MHILVASRVRILILLAVVFILWQIFRNWPGEHTVRQVIIIKNVQRNVSILMQEMRFRAAYPTH